MRDRDVVFTGPSLSAGEVRSILPAADVRPPVRRSCLRPLLETPPHSIAIIDGEFYQSLALSPKEILPFLERGVPVFGSSSMGALRAVELRSAGMRGIGKVYEMYASGEVDSDDEVAMTFCPTSLKAESQPLINFRVALRNAEEAGLVSRRERERLVTLIRRRYFPERTMGALAVAVPRVLPEARAHALVAWWRKSAPDAKAEDARMLLRHVAGLRAGL